MTVAGTITTPTQLHAVSGAAGKLERLYGADFWRAAELGVPAARGRDTVSFSAISPSWLRQAAKAWARHRLVLNYAFNTVRAAALAFKRFSTFLHSCVPPVQSPAQVGRPLIENYLAWLAQLPLSNPTKELSRVTCGPSSKRTAVTAGLVGSPSTPSSTTTKSPPDGPPCPGSSLRQ